MDRTGTNLPAVGEYNQTVVLDAIRRRPEGITRSELAALTALSGMTVTKVCRRLLDAGLVDEHGRRTSGPGKPAAVVKLNPSGGFAVGVHIDPAAVTYVLVDLSGTVRDHSRTGTPTAGDPSAVINEMADAIEALIAGSAVDRSRILGIGIASPGPVNVEDGVLLNPPMMPNWHRVALRRSLAEATGLPVLLEKDATAAVVAELWFAGPDSSRDFAFMYYGTGLGTGLSVSGEVIRGISSNAGDGGHITVDPDGPMCTCGRAAASATSPFRGRSSNARCSTACSRRPRPQLRGHGRRGRGVQQAGGPRRGREPRGDRDPDRRRAFSGTRDRRDREPSRHRRGHLRRAVLGAHLSGDPRCAAGRGA
ncbi:ROK family protein [Streptosporangium lutulentum]